MGRTRRSEIWEHLEELSTTSVRCKYLRKVLRRAKGSTTSLTNHLSKVPKVA